jgi:hypothetical protein
MMELMTFRGLRGSMKVLSGVTGAGVVVTTGAATVAYPGNAVGAGTAGTNGWPVATITRTTPVSFPGGVVSR